jgi:hypothetical protein
LSPSSPSIPRLATPPTHEWQRWHLAKLLRVFSCRVAFVWVLGVLDKVQCTFEDRSDIENRRRPRTAARPAEQPGIEREEPRVATEGARPMYMLNADREDWMQSSRKSGNAGGRKPGSKSHVSRELEKIVKAGGGKAAREIAQKLTDLTLQGNTRRQNCYWIAWRAALRRPRN